MRTIGTTKQVEQRRKRGLKLLTQGRSRCEVARQVGVSERTVRRWRQEKRERRKRQTGRRGRPSRLTAAQLVALQEALDKGAYAYGYAEDYWTLDRIDHVIWALFGVRYHQSGVWHVMRRLGWSSQQPQRQAVQRDDEQIVRWKRQVWPRIKKWRDLQVTLAFEDESGFCLVSPLKRTWARRGQTPTLRTKLSHHDRINVIGAVLVTPGGRRLRLCVQSYKCSITGQQIIRFLCQVLESLSGHIVLVWDNHPIHRRNIVRQFIARHPRLHVFCFPIYAPELNPAEGIWNQVDEYTAGTAPKCINDLSVNVQAGLARTRRSQRRLRACILCSHLPKLVTKRKGVSATRKAREIGSFATLAYVRTFAQLLSKRKILRT